MDIKFQRAFDFLVQNKQKYKKSFFMGFVEQEWEMLQSF